jgi:tetratricopeptide (TPR) repeat protein
MFHGRHGETVADRVEGRLRALKQLFDNWPGEEPEGLRELATAHALRAGAMLGYSAGRPTLAQQYLERALAIAPADWAAKESILDRVVRRLVANAVQGALVRREPLQATIGKVQAALDHWPSGLPQFRAQRFRVLGQTYSGLASVVYGTKDRRRALYCWLRAIGYEPSLLGQRRLWRSLAAIFLRRRSGTD